MPCRCSQSGRLFEPFEESHFLDYPWKLADGDALLTEEEYSAVRLEGESGEIDITEQGRIAAKFIAGVQSRPLLFTADKRWSAAALVHWLDRNIPHPDIDPTDSGIFLTRLVLALSDQRGFTLEQLILDKYRLPQGGGEENQPAPAGCPEQGVSGIALRRLSGRGCLTGHLFCLCR